MTGISGVKIKIMPSSPDANLNKIEEKAKEIIQKSGGFNREYTQEPIAFGLKAVIAFFQWPEEKETEPLEEALKNISEVQSVQIIDMRKIA
jgi:elongation factor 1-beta